MIPVALILLAQDGGDYAPDVREPDGTGAAAIEAMEVPEGFRVELWAEEPMLANPVCLWVTGDGDCYVGETFRHTNGVLDMRDFMDWLEEDLASTTVADRVAMMERHQPERLEEWSAEHDRIRLLRDTDGDGRADEAVVFADGFTGPAAGIGAGVLEHGGDVYYTCIPDLWRLEDTDGDGRADEREVLSTGYGVHIALLGHDLHGLRIGPDGRLYFSSGDRGFNVETRDGRTLENTASGAVLRCELDGSGLEIVHTGLRNPQELVFDEYGNLFTGDNNSDSIDRARFVQVVEGGDSGWRYSYQWMESPRARGPWNEEKLWHPHFAWQAAYIVPPIAWIGSGPSGLTYDPGTGLPEEFARHFFLVDFRGGRSYSGIHAFDLVPKGAGFELGEVEPFLWNALAVDADFGPDGALWFCDWVEGWSKTGRGRVYRMFHPDAVATDAAQETARILAEGVAHREPEELTRLLAHADQRVRLAAQLELAGCGDEGHALLMRTAWTGPNLFARLHGVWGYGHAARRFDADPEALVSLLGAEEMEIRAQAAKVAGDLRLETAGDLVLALLDDGSARARYFAAIAAGKLQLRSAFDALVAILEEIGEEDPILRHACIEGLTGCASESDIARLAEHPSSDVRVAAVVALRRMGSRQAAHFLEEQGPRVMLEAARALHDDPDVSGMDELRGMSRVIGTEWDPFHMTPLLSRFFATKWAPSLKTPLLRRALNAAFRSGTEENARLLALLAPLHAEKDEEAAIAALELLARWADPPRIDYVLGDYVELQPREAPYLAELAQELGGHVVQGQVLNVEGPEWGLVPRLVSDEFLLAWVAFARSAGSIQSADHLATIVHDGARSGELRAEALETYEHVGAPDLRALVDVSLADPDAELRAAALGILERLSPAEALALLPDVLATGERAEMRAAYRILSRAGGDYAESLLAADLERLADGIFPDEVQLDMVLAVEASENPRLVARLGNLRAPRMAADDQLSPWMDGLFGGNAERGAAIFERADLSCVRCHTANATSEDPAPRIGPDLAGIGVRSTRLTLLESIAMPNRRIPPGWAGEVLFLVDGSTVAGRVVSEEGGALSVLESDGALREVPLDEIDERRPDLSAMPTGLTRTLSREDMRDLLEYLASL